MRLQRGMGSCIVTMEDDAPPVDQFWAFFLKFLLQIVLLLAIDVWIHCSFGWKEFMVEDFLPIPPNRKHNLLLMKVCFRGSIWWIRRISLWSFSFNIIVDSPSFIPSYQGFKKWTMSFASNQQIADLDSTRYLGLGQGVRHPSVEYADITYFANML